MAYLEIEPPDDPDMWDWRFAMLASTTAQVGGARRGSAPLSKFMPKRRKRGPTVHTAKQQAKILEAFTSSSMPDHIAKRFN
jgi:hypothetical protein